MYRILIIEDEPLMRQGLADLLRGSGYEPLTLEPSPDTPIATTIDQILAARPDLVLLDIGLPGASGELLLKSLRAKSAVPVIMVTSRNLELDEILSMSYGADDYITKPYNPELLLLRIAAILRRLDGGSGPVQYRDVTIDLARGVLSRGDKRIFLTKNEMIILGHLLSHRGQIVARDALMTDLWNNHEYINDNALTVNVSRVRAKLKSLGLDDAVTTRKGLGYILA